jgi:hypothetical protein
MTEAEEKRWKGCPICGRSPIVWKYNNGVTAECYQGKEGHRVQAEGRTEEEAMIEWNRRFSEE